MYRGPLTDLTSNKCSYERKPVFVEARSSGVDFELSGESGIGREAGADTVPHRRLLLSMSQIRRESHFWRRELCMRCTCQKCFFGERLRDALFICRLVDFHFFLFEHFAFLENAKKS
uniref:Uncharacterized protein n=1 Tax=Ixodes ricinus TaxID=34613 RepID=A0A090XA42_IXORI